MSTCPLLLRPDPPLGLDPTTTGSLLNSGISPTSTDAKKQSMSTWKVMLIDVVCFG